MDFSHLPKSKSNWLAGVAAGIADYQSVSPLLIRAFFILLTIVTGGLGILVYSILALLMPPADR